jgi:hypothetical protein
MKKMNFLQKLLGNDKIKDEIVTGKSGTYYLYFNSQHFSWYRIRDGGFFSKYVDFAFHTDGFGDVETIYVIPTGLNKNITQEEMQRLVDEVGKKRERWVPIESESLIKNGDLFGLYVKGKMDIENTKRITQDLYILVTRKEKNDTLIQLFSMIPVGAPDELFEEVKKIFFSIKFPENI